MKLPLNYSTFDVHPPSATLHDADGTPVAGGLSVQDAAFIVRAVNAHDALVAALERMVTERHDPSGEAVQQAYAALARGEG